ncbi:hypothetical protein SK128_005101 [Halocaridina rubra]|uniref:Uncharacterized protein n=1 Tax=Halocaridina rubra TaxID=373956 RepID=A0AAN8XL34_HALRR
MDFSDSSSSNVENRQNVKILECSPPGIYPIYTCWKPESLEDFCKGKFPEERLTHISRVLHFEDYKEVFDRSSIIPHQIRAETHTSLPDGYKGSWFGSTGKESVHNWYGNVSCGRNFQDFLNKFDLKYYFIEIVEFKTLSAPRFLLTTQKVPPEVDVTEYDPRQSGGPWYQDSNGQNFYTITGPRKDNGACPYELEFFLVLSNEEYKILYSMCEVKAVNHSNANSKGYRNCKKYRSGPRWDTCPSPWSIQDCQQQLENLRAEMMQAAGSSMK